MSTKSLDSAAHILVAEIGLIGVFRNDEERVRGLHVDELVARLSDQKRVNGRKLTRCLRLLCIDHS